METLATLISDAIFLLLIVMLTADRVVAWLESKRKASTPQQMETQDDAGVAPRGVRFQSSQAAAAEASGATE